MIIKSCINCRFHEVREEEENKMSYCKKECCWAQYSDCIIQKALDRFLKEESQSPALK